MCTTPTRPAAPPNAQRSVYVHNHAGPLSPSESEAVLTLAVGVGGDVVVTEAPDCAPPLPCDFASDPDRWAELDGLELADPIAWGDWSEV